MRKTLRRLLQKGKEYKKYLIQGEKRKRHILFTPQKHSLGFLLAHTGLYSNCFRKNFAEIDFLLLLAQLSTLLLCAVIGVLMNHFSLFFFALLSIITVVRYSRSMIFSQSRVLRFLLVPLANLIAFELITVVCCIAVDLSNDPRINVIKHISHSSLIIGFLLVLFLPLLLSLMERILPKEYASPLVKNAVALIVTLISILNNTNIVALQECLDQVVNATISVVDNYGVYTATGLILVFPLSFLFILTLTYPIFYDEVQLSGDYIVLCNTNEYISDYSWVKNILYRKYREKININRKTIISLVRIKKYIEEYFKEYEIRFHISPRIELYGNKSSIVLKFEVNRKSKIVDVTLSSRAILALAEKGADKRRILKRIKEEIEVHIHKETGERVFGYLPLIVLILFMFSAFLVSDINQTAAWILIAIGVIYYLVTIFSSFVSLKKRSPPSERISLKGMFRVFLDILLKNAIIAALVGIMLLCRGLSVKPPITMNRFLETFVVNQIVILAIFMAIGTLPYLKEE
ncbi:MAG: hypothetical protein DRN04_17905 [Thermoprotei archaeon]|nr:MAG: hypothetical protein DRN04_17905 [Thermoprotei archaeon]